ncbi:uncharacterized protein LOC126994523 isoform X1 [Eriocheir sinensis]|uniref:uncharacterized protein LOC126994523 isoform X1 n=1 Tax=Eriocheir sinensis TaxID=95602 RepID=UPI0021C64793|nr:uncharacterized protein LOC126994523 isoform X1 [Eriocheir sinensis]XP_050709797.1 uncharacterized protein LOC126994523 isoform X1 [Eriocheir sinensis]
MTASQTVSPSSNPAPPSSPTPRTFIGELYSLPAVNRVCQKVVSIHATLGRLVPFSRLFTTVLSIASALTHRVGQWDFVRTAVQRGDAIGLLALDYIRGSYLHPRDYLQKLMDGVQGVVVRGASVLAVHPFGRLPCRVTLEITGRIQSILEALKLNDKPCLGEVFIIGRLQRIYSRGLATLAVRVKTCNCVLENLQKEIKNAEKAIKNAEAETNLDVLKKRKRSVNDGNGRNSSSSDDEPSEPLETSHSKKEDEHHGEGFASPVNINVTQHD